MSDQKSLSTRSWLELILLGLIWGASFLAIRIALDEIGPLTSVAHRTGWAMLALWLVVICKGIPLPRAPQVWGAFLGMGLLNNVIPFGLMAWGQLHIESGLTAILNATTAVFGVIIAALFFADERLTLRKGIGVLLGFAGVALAMGPGSLLRFDVTNLAQLAVLAGTLSYAFAGIWARRFLTSMPPQLAAAGMLTGSTCITLPLAWWLEGPIVLDLAWQSWAAIGYYSLVATAGAYLLYYRILAAAGASNLLLVTLIIPPISIVLGASVRAESLGPNALAGFACLALGLLILDGRVMRAVDRRKA